MKTGLLMAGAFLLAGLTSAAAQQQQHSYGETVEVKAKQNQAKTQGRKRIDFDYPFLSFQSTNTRAKRNLLRYDLTHCGYFAGGPQGAFVPAHKDAGPGAPPGLHGRFGAAYTGNCDRKEAFAAASVMAKGFLLKGMSYLEDVGSFADGSGNTVRYGQKKRMGTGAIGYVSPVHKFILNGGIVERTDILFGGAPVDTRELNVGFGTLQYRYDNNETAINKIAIVGRLREMDRTNDNFTYRVVPTGQPKVMVNLENEEQYLKTMFGFRTGRIQHMVGGAYNTENRDATRFRDHAVLGSLAKQNRNFADSTITRYSVIYQGVVPLAQTRRLKLWGQYDHVEADAAAANEVQLGRPGGAPVASNQQWLATYGVTGDDTKREDNFSGSLRYEQDFGKGSQWYVEGGRYMRTADMYERFFSSWAGPSGTAGGLKNWVGNPEIDPEAHHKLSAGVKLVRGPAEVGFGGYADFVNDYIIHDRARGQAGILLNDGSNVYRNVDARIFAAAVALNWRFAPGWKLGLWSQIAYGQNTEDDRPLAQIPPLEGQLTLEYSQPKWSVGGRVRAVAKQSRADIDPAVGSGEDDEKTAGFVTIDLFATIRPAKFASIAFGVENLFDETYKEHIDRVDINDPDKTRINMPGRTFWTRGNAKF